MNLYWAERADSSLSNELVCIEDMLCGPGLLICVSMLRAVVVAASLRFDVAKKIHAILEPLSLLQNCVPLSD
jgi:hypothetical protein